ncbi:MAG: biopolymer transporter ExbD [Candidatus Paceibacterota bacterium]
MAEINASVHNNKRGGIRSKKLSTRVDLTPMVDLGFLLITFFIFTTTMQDSHAMKLNVPNDRDVKEPSTTAESKTISFILGADNVIYYYNGLNKQGVRQTDYSPSGLRIIIQQKMEAVKKQFGHSGEIVVLIKPTDASNYQNLVNVLDEMMINNVRKYMMIDPEKDELRVLQL